MTPRIHGPSPASFFGEESNIHINHLTVRFGSITALFDITVQIPQGAVVMVLGPNGSGKSTLLSAISGLIIPSGGYIRLPPCRMNYMMHRPMLYDELTVRENLDLTARLYNARDLENSEYLIHSLDLSPIFDQTAGTLSRGQLQRAGAARAFWPGPGILLLDEPFSNMDNDHANMIEECILKYRSPSHTVLFTSHNTKTASRLADYVLRLESGKLREFSRAEETA